MKIWINSCHAALEYDQAKLFSELGLSVSGLFDVGSKQRPKVKGVTDVDAPAEIHEANKTRDIQLSQIGDPDVIIVHQTSDFVERTLAYAKQAEHTQVVQIIFGQGNSVQHQMLAQVARDYHNVWIVPYALKEFNMYSMLGAPADRLRMIRFGKPHSDFQPRAWKGTEPCCFVPCNSVHKRGDGCNWNALQLLMGSGINLVVGGKDTEEIGGLGELTFDQYRDWLQRAQCYLHLGTIPAPYTLTLVEAACSGTPIVGMNNGHGLATEGLGIQISKDVCEVLGFIRRILQDPDVRQHAHEHSCYLADTAFSGSIVRQQWFQLLLDIEVGL